LDDPELLDRRGELGELLLVEVLPRLPGVRGDLLDGARERRAVSRRRGRRRQERVEPAAEGPARGGLRALGRHRARASFAARGFFTVGGSCSWRISRARLRYPWAPFDAAS